MVRQSVKIRDHSAPQLVIECRHKAARMTVGRRSVYYFDQTDSDIIEQLLTSAGIQPDVESTSARHKQQVQYRATDWDFLLSRAEANGRVVFTSGDKVVVKAPTFDGSPTVTLLFGATILEFDGEIDARLQVNSVKSLTWDPAQQAVVEREARDPRVSGPGNLTTADLAAVAALDTYELRHIAVAEDEAQAWADAEWLKTQMSRVSGRAKCEGLATIHPGDIAAVDGIGDRFSGKVFVAGVRHEFDTVQGWKTHVQFGGTDIWMPDEPSMSAPAAGGLLPRVNGLQIGIVTSNEDPAGEHRVRVRLPTVTGDDDGHWARVASADAGSDRGLFIRPEIGDEVIVGFLEDDPRAPVILRMLHSSAKAAPLEGSDGNHEKVLQTRSGMKVYFNDEKKVLQLETPGGNRVTLTEDNQGIQIVDQNGNSIETSPSSITVTGAANVEIKASGNLTLEAGGSLAIKGSAALQIQASGALELAGSATTKITGALVQIN